MDNETTWKELIENAIKSVGDNPRHILANTFQKNEWEKKFDINDIPEIDFSVYTHERVYFPICDDEGMVVESVLRHPRGEGIFIDLRLEGLDEDDDGEAEVKNTDCGHCGGE